MVIKSITVSFCSILWMSLGSCTARQTSPSSPSESRFKVEFTPELTDGTELPFEPHVGTGKFSNFLMLNLPFTPAHQIKKEVEKSENIKLKDRGEAHITVITPPEFDSALSEKIEMNEINDIALKQNIQSSEVTPLCVGKFAKPEDKNLATYFVVVESEDLMAIRKQVEELYLQRGGDPKSFKANDFAPHITLGFTQRDLHKESDGAIKDKSSCLDK